MFFLHSHFIPETPAVEQEHGRIWSELVEYGPWTLFAVERNKCGGIRPCSTAFDLVRLYSPGSDRIRPRSAVMTIFDLFDRTLTMFISRGCTLMLICIRACISINVYKKLFMLTIQAKVK